MQPENNDIHNNNDLGWCLLGVIGGVVAVVGIGAVAAAHYLTQPPTIDSEEDLKIIVKSQMLDLANTPTLIYEEYPPPTDDIVRGDLLYRSCILLCG
jgi:hypothetical protein